MEVLPGRACAACPSSAAGGVQRQPSRVRTRALLAARTANSLCLTSRHARRHLYAPVVPRTALADHKLRAAPASENLPSTDSGKAVDEPAADKQVRCGICLTDSVLPSRGAAHLAKAQEPASHCSKRLGDSQSLWDRSGFVLLPSWQESCC